MIAVSELLVLLLAVRVLAIPPLQIQNNRFMKAGSAQNQSAENEIFFIKGIDYQPGGSSGFDAHGNQDILTDPAICARDVFALQQLGANTIRIYQLNPDLNHDECMTMLNNAGIYVILDVNSGNFGEHLNRADPGGTYNAQYLNRVFRFIEAFKNYPNVLGFFSGNEVINDEDNYAKIDPPYLRALQRDMKRYIAKHCNRSIPVGYSAADNMQLRLATFKYLQCNSLDGQELSPELHESRSDFYGLNSYQWCSGISNWQTSGYGKLASTFNNTTIPLIFSEYGCNENSPRTFTEVSEGLYNGLIDSFSGGLIYEFSEETNGYGLVYIDDADGTITYKQDFENLVEQFAAVKAPQTIKSQLSNSSLIKCDSNEIESLFEEFGTQKFWIPPQPKDIADMIENGVNGASPGFILNNYSAPKTLEYKVKDVQGKPIQATLTWNEQNAVNSLASPMARTTFTYNTTRSSAPTENVRASSTSPQNSTSLATSVDKYVSSTKFHSLAGSSSTSNSRKSKAEAANLMADSMILPILLVIFYQFL